MIYLASLAGFGLYIVYIWFGWSNKEDEGTTELSFKQMMHLERQELVITFIGALLFMWGGEGMVDTVCDAANYFGGENLQDFCISMQVNMEELIYVIGGASFGSVGLWAVKYYKKKAKKKLDS